jgi:hypothetical protein
VLDAKSSIEMNHLCFLRLWPTLQAMLSCFEIYIEMNKLGRRSVKLSKCIFAYLIMQFFQEIQHGKENPQRYGADKETVREGTE